MNDHQTSSRKRTRRHQTIPTHCPQCGTEYHHLIPPQPKMQSVTKMIIGIGVAVTLLAMLFGLCLPLLVQDGFVRVGVSTVLVYTLPFAIPPMLVTIFIAAKIKRQLTLTCKTCQHAEVCLIK